MARSNQSFEHRMSLPGLTSNHTNSHGEVRVYRPGKGLVKVISQEKVKKMKAKIFPAVGEVDEGETYVCIEEGCANEGVRKVKRQVRCASCQEERIKARARETSRQYQAAERKRLKYAKEKAEKKRLHELKQGEDCG